MKNQLMTPFEYVATNTLLYPSLYASPSFDITKFKLFDMLFNVIGNTVEYSNLIAHPISEKQIKLFHEYTSLNDAVYLVRGYTQQQVQTYVHEGKLYSFNRFIGDCVYTINTHQHEYPNIIHWQKDDRYEEELIFAPYPNFKKQYSFVWRGFPEYSSEPKDKSFFQLGNEWIEAAIWFYKKCLEFFNDPVLNKSYVYAVDIEKMANDANIKNKHVSGWKSALAKYNSNEEITQAYKCEFIGDKSNADDILAFTANKWNKELQEILLFINETLEMLYKELNK